MLSLRHIPPVATILVWLCGPPSSFARQVASRDIGEPGSELKISLITIGPGAEVWERFGHNAIWVQDTLAGTGRLYNYGIFDFNQESFLLRFIQGRMVYEMQGYEPNLDSYISRNRSVWIQDLNFTQAQRDELRDFLEWNDLPENRKYRYDYYLDNCSTRVRDALDRVLRGQIKNQTDRFAAGTTYRFHTQRMTTNDVFIYTGLLIALGLPVDRPITLWEEMFLPVSLQQHLREVSIRGPDGIAQPFVTAERTVFESTAVPVDDLPPSWMLRYLVLGFLVATVMLWFAVKAPNSRWAAAAFGGLGTLWALVVGVLGTVLFGLWLATDHAAAYWNENLFAFNPLCLALAFLLPGAALGAEWAGPAARKLSVAVAGLTVFGFAVQLLPWFDQINGQLYAVVLLPNIVLAIGVYRVAAPEHAPESEQPDTLLAEESGRE